MKRSEPVIRVDEWLSELTKLEAESRNNGDPAGFSVLDVQRALKLEDRTVRRRMREWFLRGLIEYVGKRETAAMDGRRAWSPIYRIVQKEKKRASRV